MVLRQVIREDAGEDGQVDGLPGGLSLPVHQGHVVPILLDEPPHRLQAGVPRRDHPVLVDDHRDLEAELLNAVRHILHGNIVVPGVPGVGDQGLIMLHHNLIFHAGKPPWNS